LPPDVERWQEASTHAIVSVVLTLVCARTEVARIEVRAALDRADSLKTVPAKRRAIQEAIDYVRRDSVPDELQAEEIGLLTAALSELDGPQ
jgi:hypothetical protein